MSNDAGPTYGQSTEWQPERPRFRVFGLVVAWLAEGRSPTIFLHTPDNVEALNLARRFHAEVRAIVPGVEPLPEPAEVEPPTLF